MEQTEWLKTLKQGDEVVLLKSSWSGSKYSIKEVEKVTPTGRIIVDGVTFLPNGRKWSGTTGYARIEPVTDEHRKSIETEAFLRYAYRVIDSVARREIDLTPKQMEAIVKIIEDGVHA